MGIWEKIKKSFISGLIIVAPFLILLIILQTLFNTVLIVVNPLVKGLGLEQRLASVLVAQGIGIAFLILLTVLLGAIKRYRPDDGMLNPLGDAVDLVPAFSTMYNSMQKMGEALSGGGDQYDRAVLVEYPRENMYHLGFVTGEAPEAEKELDGGDDFYSVFVPFSPNMTNGNLIFVKEEEMTDLDLEVSEAIEMSISLGAVDPEEEE